MPIRNVYGSMYVYYACTDRCNNPDVTCPYDNRTLSYNSCPHMMKSLFYTLTLAPNQRITLVDRGTYRDEIFSCK